MPNFIGFLTIIDEFSISISAPNFLQASIVAIVSADSNALFTLLLFPASDARKIALCVYLLFGGQTILPEIFDFSILQFMNFRLLVTDF